MIMVDSYNFILIFVIVVIVMFCVFFADSYDVCLWFREYIQKLKERFEIKADLNQAYMNFLFLFDYFGP